MRLNTVCHIEFDVTDLDRSQAFYEGLFGWAFQEFMGGTMRVFGLGDDHIGGLTKRDAVAPGMSPSIWFQVEDVAATLERVTRLGGTVLSGREAVPGVGFTAQVADPDGNPVGLVQDAA